MIRPKILFLTSGRDSPSSRFRVIQYLPLLKDLARVSVSPCRPPKDLTHRDLRYGGWPLDLLLFVGKLVSRLTAICRGPLHDLVYLDGVLLAPWAPGLEKLAIRLAPRAIFDFGEAPHLKHTAALAAICRRVGNVIAGNEELAGFARPHEARVTVVPTAIDTGGWTPGARDRKTVVWTGMADDLKQLAAVRPRIRRPLRVVCTRKPDFECEFVPWSRESEKEALRSASVGILPLPDDERTRGRCGIELLQYMACGLPCVASPVGVNADIVGPTGIVTEDWESGIEQALAMDGRAARARVQERHSVQAVFPRWWAAIQTAIS